MKNKKSIIFVLTLPPPIHGSAVMNKYIKDSRLLNEAFNCDYINISTSRQLNDIGKYNPIKLLRVFVTLMVLLWKLATRRYDLCYLAITCHGIGFLKDAPFVLLCHLFKKKIVIHQHNKGMKSDVGKWPYRLLLSLVYKNVKVILLSWRLYSDIERIVPKENVYVCPNGIANCDYKYKERHNDILHLLFLSNLIESKGVILLLDALKQLKDKGITFVCDFIGGETKEINRKRFEEEVERRELERMAIYRGMKFGRDKEKYFVQADIFVFPTHYHNECFPLVLLEAMQYGLPIVTTDEGGIPDMIKNGENGLICDKNDSESLAKCIELLVSDQALRNKMGKEGLRRYREEYVLDVFEDRIRSFLER